MTKTKTGTKSKNTPVPPAPVPSENDQAEVIERPDGFYWQDKPTGKEYGPFPTLLEAEQDMQYEADSLEDAEEEIGISSWIDPETGEPAEGTTPHLSDE